MKIQLGSAWRNSGHNVPVYIQRATALRNLLHNVDHEIDFSVIAGEGDSADRTRAWLLEEAQSYGLNLQVIDTTHGQRVFGSTEEVDRLRTLSDVLNKIVGGVHTDTDVFVYVESDLMWEPSTLLKLIRLADAERDTIFAPMIIAGRAFYDIWGFRQLNGERFNGPPPFAPGIDGCARYPVSSVGSCCAMSGEIARRTRVRNDMAFVGWCEDARLNGAQITVIPELRVFQA